MQGWIKLHRTLQSNKLWYSEPFTKAQAWVDLILSANHKEGAINVRGNIINIKRGQVGRSETTLSVNWKWSRNKVRRFLKWLKTEQQIEQQKSTILSLITIVNYDTYQEKSTADDTADDTAEGQQTIQQTDTNKNGKKKKNDKNVYMEFVKLTSAEHTKLIDKYGAEIIEEYMGRLDNYIGQQGKDKYASHYHTILAWTRKDGAKKEDIIKKDVQRLGVAQFISKYGEETAQQYLLND